MQKDGTGNANWGADAMTPWRKPGGSKWLFFFSGKLSENSGGICNQAQEEVKFKTCPLGNGEPKDQHVLLFICPVTRMRRKTGEQLACVNQPF